MGMSLIEDLTSLDGDEVATVAEIFVCDKANLS